jgi:hypothetical protein
VEPPHASGAVRRECRHFDLFLEYALAPAQYGRPRQPVERPLRAASTGSSSMGEHLVEVDRDASLC